MEIINVKTKDIYVLFVLIKKSLLCQKKRIRTAWSLKETPSS